jgi:YegS/Rv2252/BmrU family lipid kinase
MLYIIVNPASKSGLGHKRWEIFKQQLNENHMVYSVFFTQKGKGAKDCVAEILKQSRIHTSALHNETSPVFSAKEAQDILVVLGGDGTMNEVVNALLNSDLSADFKAAGLSLAYLPTGSSNDLARALQIDDDPAKLIARLKKRDSACQHADLGYVTYEKNKSRYFNVSCGIGLDAAVCKEALASPIKNTLNRLHLGKLTYAFIAVKQLIAAPLASCDITLDDGEVRHFDKLLFAVAMIHPYEGGGIKMTPMADCRDGQLDIMVIANLAKWRALYLLPLAFFGLHVNAKNVYFFKSNSLHITTDTPLIVHADGEYCGTQQQLSVFCQKNLIKFF